jgi:hypothetical protein
MKALIRYVIGALIVIVFSVGFPAESDATESAPVRDHVYTLESVSPEWHTRVWATTFIPEDIGRMIADSLISSGAYAVQGDACECLYWSDFRFVFEV